MTAGRRDSEAWKVLDKLLPENDDVRLAPVKRVGATEWEAMYRAPTALQFTAKALEIAGRRRGHLWWTPSMRDKMLTKSLTSENDGAKLHHARLWRGHPAHASRVVGCILPHCTQTFRSPEPAQ